MGPEREKVALRAACRARANPWPVPWPRVLLPGCGRARSVPPAAQGLSRRLSLRGEAGEAGEAEEGLADDLALGVEAVGFLIGDLNVNGYLRPRS